MEAKLEAASIEKARRHLRRHDSTLAQLMRRVGPCRFDSRGDPYRGLVRSVIYQQLAGAAATAIAGRLKARHRGRFPGTRALLAESDLALREVGLSRQKIATLRAIATAFDEGVLGNRALRRLDDDGVVAEVTKLKGIGEWTAHMLLMFSLGRPDVLPVGDYGVRKGAQSLYGLKDLPGCAELEALAKPWQPYRSVASWYLWRAADESK